MAKSFIRTFDTVEAAQHAIHGLRHAGIPQEHMQMVEHVADSQEARAKVAGWLIDAGLSEDQAAAHLADISPGQMLVLVSADDFTIETAYDTLRYHGMTDVNQQATRRRIAQRDDDTAQQDPRFTPSETVDPSAAHKWQESNKLLTATGGVAGSIHGAALGGLLAGPAGIAAGAAIGGTAGGASGALADATFEAVKQEDAVRQEDAAEDRQERDQEEDGQSSQEAQ